MRHPELIRVAALAAALGAGGAFAQVTAPVITDVGPPPAEERASTGAIVLENSPVRAQRESEAFKKSAATRPSVAAVGRGVMRATAKAEAEAETARARGEPDLHRMGAGAGDGK